jgi:hypothetical protein
MKGEVNEKPIFACCRCRSADGGVGVRQCRGCTEERAATGRRQGLHRFPADGATVDKTFTVKFGIEGIALKPAGDQTAHSGHHHLLVDVDKAPVADMPLPTSLMPENNAPLPAGPQVLHFGKAQTEATITLTPGKHTLQLVLGDKYHVPFKPSVESQKITVDVK